MSYGVGMCTFDFIKARSSYLAAVILAGVFLLVFVNAGSAIDRTCSSHTNFSLAVHGGAVWGSASHAKKENFIEQALIAGRGHLKSGERALSVVQDIIVSLENSGLFNAGKASIANKQGDVEMDASLMEGRHLRAGAVASIRGLKNPILAARHVMDNTPHVMMVGPNAEDYLAGQGVERVDASYFLNNARSFSELSLPNNVKPPTVTMGVPTELAQFTGVWKGVLSGRLKHLVVIDDVSADGATAAIAFPATEDLGLSEPVSLIARAKFLNSFLVVESERFRVAYRVIKPGQLEVFFASQDKGRVSGTLENDPSVLKKSGTVGAVALDRCGNLAAGTSTGGFSNKLAGRVGDSPVIGAGTYADNRSAAISATGHGEYFIRHAVAHEIAARVRHAKQPLIRAVYQVIFKELKTAGGSGGVIAVDKAGDIVMLFNTDGMVRGSTTDKLSPSVHTYAAE